MDKKTAISAINKAGALLVFPIDNRKEPASIWSAFFPKTPMRWEWDENGDGRVGDLWHLRSELSTTGKVVYTKWYRGRATYFSKPLFTAMLKALNPDLGSRQTLSSTARKVLDVLETESPLSTKEVKRMADLKGKNREAEYNRALKELWSKLLIVAYGEVDDGAFPSLAIGSTQVLFEDLWRDAIAMNPAKAILEITRILDRKNPFYQFFSKLHQDVPMPQKIEKSAVADVVSFEDL